MAKDQTAAEQRPKLSVSTKDSGPARKLLTIEIPETHIHKKIEQSYGQLQDDAQLPGFRKGRAPRRLLEKRFGSSVRGDVKGQLLSECYDQAVEDVQIKVIGGPDIKDLDTIELPDAGPLTFAVEVEVSPQVTLPDFSKLKVTKTAAAVTDKDVDNQIEQLQERFGKSVEISGAKVEYGDFVQADVLVLAGQDVGDDAEQVLHLPGAMIYASGKDRQYKGHVAGILVEDMGHRLNGKAVGDRIEFSMDGPESHENEKIRNQPITIRANISKVERLELASLEIVAEQLGVESQEQLRSRLKESLEGQKQRQQQADMHEQINKQLLELVDLELPEGLTSRQVERTIHRQRLELMYRGVSESEVDQQIAERRTESESVARKQLKLFFILDQAAKDLEIEVSTNEINGRVAMMAVQQGRRPEKLRQQMQQRGELEQLYLQIREQSTLDQILENAAVTEVTSEAPPKKKTKRKSTVKKEVKKTTRKKTTSKKST